MLIAQLLALGVVAAQTPATVTFEAPAAPLKRLMPQLAQAMGKPLKASKAIENEVLCLAVHNADPTELLRHIAQATASVWKQTSDGLYLTPDAGARNQLAQRGAQRRVPGIQKVIDSISPSAQAKVAAKMRADIQRNGGPAQLLDDFDFSMFGSDSSDPIFYELLTAIGASTFAEASSKGRIVFSSHPTQRQRPIPGDIGDSVASFVQRYNAQADKAKARLREILKQQGVEVPLNMDQFFPASEGKIDKPVSKIDFVVSAGSDVDSWQCSCQLICYDANGHVLAHRQRNVTDWNWSSDGSGVVGGGDAAPDKAAESPAEPPIKLQPATRQFMMVLWPDNSDSRPVGADVMALVRARLRHPEQFDPLSYPAELLSGAATAKGLQLVACLPDRFFEWCTSYMLDSSTPAEVFQRLSSNTYLASDNSGGWLTVAPTAFEAEPLNRERLAGLSKEFDGVTDMTLDGLLDLARNGYAGYGEEGILGSWMVAVCPMLETLDQEESWRMLRLFANIDPLQRQMLAQHQKVVAGSLGTAAAASLEELVYLGPGNMNSWGGEASLDVEVPAEQVEPQVPPGSFSPQGDDYRSEPTEFLPIACPPQATLELDTSDQSVIRPAKIGFLNRDQLSDMSGISVQQVINNAQERQNGWGGFDDDNPRSQGRTPPSDPTNYRRVQVGTHRTYHFKINVGPGVFRSADFMVPSFADAKQFTLTTLPPDLQKEHDEAMQAWMEEYQRAVKSGRTGDKTKP
ncbi:MAG TPA: hypothetical protein VKT78_00725 [Fimbriimonadaceae bacterium]|nr:hypothetical protein [Fimbriimonadaceae bacterium]